MSMTFSVPQFIEVESKIIGPISVRQFIILLVSAGIMWFFWEVFTFWLAAIIDVFILAVGGSLAFVKVNSQPMHIFMLCYIQTMKNPNLKIWRKGYKSPTVQVNDDENKDAMNFTPKVQPSQSRLAELSLLVDTGGVYKPEELQTQVQNKVKNNIKNNDQ